MKELNNKRKSGCISMPEFLWDYIKEQADNRLMSVSATLCDYVYKEYLNKLENLNK